MGLNRWKRRTFLVSGVALLAIAIVVGSGWYISEMIRQQVLELKQGRRPLDLEVAGVTDDHRGPR